MTTKTKWVLVAVVAAMSSLMPFAMVLVWRAVSRGGLPVYTLAQTDSSHPWYRRTTVTSGTKVFVQDYEEYAVRLAYPEPTNAVGRTAFGGGKICSIPGQPPTDYLAVDCGSEMPAYELFRNTQRPPFDWRTAKFQELEFAGTIGLTEHKRTTDPALIEDVVRTLREGTPTTLALPASVAFTNIDGVHLFSDQLPGLMFSPAVYRDAAGPVYLAESFAVEFTNRTQRIHANWIPVSPRFAEWVKTP